MPAIDAPCRIPTAGDGADRAIGSDPPHDMRVAVSENVAARTVSKDSIGVVEPSRGRLEKRKETGQGHMRMR